MNSYQAIKNYGITQSSVESESGKIRVHNYINQRGLKADNSVRWKLLSVSQFSGTFPKIRI